MVEHDDQAERTEGFDWHPEYADRSVQEVRQELTSQIGTDQRQHRLAMDGAEEAEHDALASIVKLERRWGPYDFDWADQEPGALAERIVAFELERERRREMISWPDYRASEEAPDDQQSEFTSSRELSTTMKGVSLLVVALLIVLILVIVAVL